MEDFCVCALFGRSHGLVAELESSLLWRVVLLSSLADQCGSEILWKRRPSGLAPFQVSSDASGIVPL